MEEELKILLPKTMGAFQLTKMQVAGEGEHQSLNIELQHSISLEIYDVTITLEDIRRYDILKSLYGSVEEFKEALETELESWSVAENGDLTYQY